MTSIQSPQPRPDPLARWVLSQEGPSAVAVWPLVLRSSLQLGRPVGQHPGPSWQATPATWPSREPRP